MLKKFFVLIISVITIIGIMGLTGCDTINLAEYKESAKESIQTYAMDKISNNMYNEEKLVFIENLISAGYDVLELANNKNAVDASVEMAKKAIDGVAPISLNEYKEIAKESIQSYWLEISLNMYAKENLLIIENLVTEGYDTIELANNKLDIDNSVAMIKDDIDDVEPLMSKELLDQFKAAFLQKFKYEIIFGERKLSDKFYGIYNDAVVFLIVFGELSVSTVIMSGVEFTFPDNSMIFIWKDNVFYELCYSYFYNNDIFDLGLLTQQDLEEIGKIHEQMLLNAYELEKQIKNDNLIW